MYLEEVIPEPELMTLESVFASANLIGLISELEKMNKKVGINHSKYNLFFANQPLETEGGG